MTEKKEETASCVFAAASVYDARLEEAYQLNRSQTAQREAKAKAWRKGRRRRQRERHGGRKISGGQAWCIFLTLPLENEEEGVAKKAGGEEEEVRGGGV